VSGVDVSWRSKPAPPEAAKVVHLMASDSPATAEEAIDSVGVTASTMVVTTSDDVAGSVAALSAATASPAPTVLAIEGSPPKPATAHEGVAGAQLHSSKSTAGVARSAQSGWDSLTASADATPSSAWASSDRLGTAVPRHAVAAGSPLDSGHRDDGPSSIHAPVALGPAVRSHRTIEVLTFSLMESILCCERQTTNWKLLVTCQFQ